MFDNLLFQSSSQLLTDDIKNNRLPSSILLSGPEASGKLTCALEITRALSCTGSSNYEKGHWLCDCPSCKKQKELSGTNVILAGPRDCALEILAAKRTLLFAGANNSSFMNAARYLFIRAVRKLTLRFSPVLWEKDKNLSKISPLVEEINDKLELLNPDKPLPENEELEKITDKIIEIAEKLDKLMYTSLPIDHIRKASTWAHLRTSEGKKVLIIENADRMNESTRNALLKILEEPPSDVVFIMTTSRRGAVMPTILSRVRTYNFTERTLEQQATVIERIFHEKPELANSGIQSYLNSFLPVSTQEIKNVACEYFDGIKNNYLIQIPEIVKKCGDFEPKVLFKIFLQELIEVQRFDLIKNSNGSGLNSEVQLKNIRAIGECYNNLSVYNQRPVAALEKLYRDLAAIRKMNLR